MARRSHSVPLNAQEEAFLRAFGRAILTVPRALDADLLREQGMAMSEYSALMFLSEAPGLRLRMGDLALASALSLSGISRIVDRLERRGLVRRERCSSDARGWEAVLTDAGFERLRQAWPTHLASVRRHVIDHLEGLDLPTLTAALQRFAADETHPGVAQQDPDEVGFELGHHRQHVEQQSPDRVAWVVHGSTEVESHLASGELVDDVAGVR